jgi:hypothetical protein
MKKIICLIDYTLASENAMQYAAHLARDTSAKLVLATLQHHKAPKKALAMAGEDDESLYHSSRLPEMCDRVRGVWKVPCEYQESIDVENQTDLIRQDVHLVVMGINSSKKTTPYLLSSDIDFKMIRESRIPVLLVPDNFEYHKLSRMLYAYDYANEATPPLDQLKELSEWLKADLRFLSVVDKSYSPEVENLLDERNAEIISHWKSGRKLTFDYIYYSDVKKCIDHYLELWRSDDIVIFSIDHPTFLHRLFHKSVIREMTVCGSYPILIIHK